MPDSTWQVEVDRATPEAWAGMLDLFDDANLYQTWSYGATRWGHKNLSHLVLKRQGEVIAIAQLRIIRPTPLSFGIAYLRWGPLWERRDQLIDPVVAQIMAKALQEEYVVKRRLALRVLPNAFAGSSRATCFETAFSGFTEEAVTADSLYRTFVLDLSPTLEELRRKLDAKWRNKLTQSEKKGLTVVAGDSTQDYAKFVYMYREMKQRKGFHSTVDVEDFAAIQRDLPPAHRLRVWTGEDTGVPVAALVVAAMGDSAIYLLGATSDQGLNARGAYLLQWNAIQWLKINGFKWYDLGGIDPKSNPGVYQFKRGMAGSDMVQIGTRVHCDSLLSSAIVHTGVALQRGIRSCKKLLQSGRPLTPQVSRN
jgi:lipid II:glycine glycyltransferase (peptidoglycan interpeptide bridge formation enzyme)